MSAGPPNGYQRFLDLPQAELERLRERAREIATVTRAEDTVDLIDVLEVRSHGQGYALPLEAVEGIDELVSVAPVPQAPQTIRGLVTFRGEVLLATELSSLMGAQESGFADLRRVIAIGAGGLRLALLTEQTLVVNRIDVAAFSNDKLTRQPFIQGTDDRFVSLIDCATLIRFVFDSVRT